MGWGQYAKTGGAIRLIPLIVGLLTALSVPSWGQEQSGAGLFVNSAPLGAEVFLDGSGLGGRTPMLLRELQPGLHSLELRKQGFQACSLKIGLAAGKTRVVSVDLAEHGISTSFPAEKEVFVAGKAEAAGDRILYLERGDFSIAREQGMVFLDPLFPQQRLIDALNITIPIMLTFASLLTVDAVFNPPNTSWPLPPAVLAAHGITLSMIGLDIGLNLRKRRQSNSYSFTARDALADRRLAGELFTEAERDLERGMLQEAAERYTRIIRSQPDSPLLPAALYRLGSIQYLLGDNDAAVGSFESITREYPTAELYDQSHKNLADLRLRMGEFAASLRHLDDMVFVDPLFSREEIAVYRCSILEEWAQADPAVKDRHERCLGELVEKYPGLPAVQR